MDRKLYTRALTILLILGLIEIIAFAVYENIYLRKALDATNSVVEPGNYNDCESLEERANIHRNSLHFSDTHFKVELVRDYDKYSNGYSYEYKLVDWAWLISQLRKDEDGDVHSIIIYPTNIYSKHRIGTDAECLNKAYTNFCEQKLKGKDVTSQQIIKIEGDIEKAIGENPVYIYEKVNCNNYQEYSLNIDNYRVDIIETCSRKIALTHNFSYWNFKDNVVTGSYIIFASFLILFTGLRITDWRNKKRELEDSKLYKLRKKCNPENFMKPYQKEKIDKANEIYAILMKTNPNDNNAINQLEIRIEKELSISRIDCEELQILRKRCNPQNFMSPYMPEKVALANEIYSQLMKKDLTFEEYEALKMKSEQLYNN